MDRIPRPRLAMTCLPDMWEAAGGFRERVSMAWRAWYYPRSFVGGGVAPAQEDKRQD